MRIAEIERTVMSILENAVIAHPALKAYAKQLGATPGESRDLASFAEGRQIEIGGKLIPFRDYLTRKGYRLLVGADRPDGTPEYQLEIDNQADKLTYALAVYRREGRKDEAYLADELAGYHNRICDIYLRQIASSQPK